MIRSHKLINKIPRKLINSIKEKNNVYWSQTVVESKELRNWAIKQSRGISKKKNISVILHHAWGQIDEHSDNLCKSCNIIPLKSGKLTRLVVEGNSKVYMRQMEVGKVFVFNDENRHGILNEENCCAIFLTVD